jgi:hypothetical protein
MPSLKDIKSRTVRRLLLCVAVAALALAAQRWTNHMPSAGPAVAFADDQAQPADAGKGAGGADRRDQGQTRRKGRNASPEIEYLPRPSRFEEELLSALEKPINVDYHDLGLEDCLHKLEETARISFWFDKQSLADEGVALDQPVALKLHGARLESALNLLLKPVQLAYFPEDDVLYITTGTKAGEHLITRTYPVRDLYQGRIDPEPVEPAETKDKAAAGSRSGHGIASVDSRARRDDPQIIGVIRQHDASRFSLETGIELAQGFGGGAGGGMGGGGGGRAMPPKKYADLVDAITNTIEPDSWEELSGPGTYTYVKETGCLVIRQTWAIHRQILQLLRDLREAKHLAPGQFHMGELK